MSVYGGQTQTRIVNAERRPVTGGEQHRTELCCVVGPAGRSRKDCPSDPVTVELAEWSDAEPSPFIARLKNQSLVPIPLDRP
jgi:hypothetical protein